LATEGWAIETQQLTRRYDSVAAVSALDLRVAYGVLFGLLGANGAGKSTTIKMLTTLVRPSSGSATVAGFDVARASADVRRHIGYVPQMLSADGALTAHENLLLSARLYGVPYQERAARIGEALEFMKLTEVAHRRVKTFSGGMIRRLELAQAMLHRPQVLFLDEPTIGLDPVARHAVWDRLIDLQARYRMTILLTTHDMEEADRLCGDVAILHEGRLAARGTVSELKARVGEHASMDDVFAHFSAASERGARLQDTADVRHVARRLG
jgi:ABC-2 type transport system ATP-binding protein